MIDLDTLDADAAVAYMQEQSRGHTVYMLNTFFGEGSEVVEDSEQDLVKIGESVNPVERLRSYWHATPVPVRLTCTLHPFRDRYVHAYLSDAERWEQALEMNLPTPYEWYRGGSEFSFIHSLLHSPDFAWVQVRTRTQEGEWMDVSAALR